MSCAARQPHCSLLPRGTSISSKRPVLSTRVLAPACLTNKAGHRAVMRGNPGSQRVVARSAWLRVVSHAEAVDEDVVSKEYVPGLKSELTTAEVDKLDIRVGYISEARPVNVEIIVTRGDRSRKSNKQLLEMEVDIGTETRTIVADIINTLDEQMAVGKKIIVIANVEPTMIHGRPSHGKVLLGENFDPTPMPRSFKHILPGTGRLPAGAQYSAV